jgi:hypothetical protein
MADTPITGFTADTNPALVDLVVTAKSPFGAGSNRKVTLGNMLIATVVDYYVNTTTGNDTTGTGTLLLPWKTIQKALDQIAGRSFSAKVIIHVADGTYAENLIIKDLINNPVTADNQAFGNSIVEILGNTTTPNSVKIRGDGTNFGTISAFGNVVLVVNGCNVNSTDLTADVFEVFGNATLFIQNCNSTSAVGGSGGGYFISASDNARVYIDDMTTGGTVNMSRGSISALERALVTVSATLDWTLPASTGQHLGANFQSLINIYAPQTFRGCSIMAASDTEGVITLDAGGTITVTGAVNAVDYVLRAGNEGKIYISDTTTLTMTSCTQFMQIREGGYVADIFGAATYNFAGGTPQTYDLYVGGQALSFTNFGGCTANGAENDSDFKYGFDFRYVTTVAGRQSGTLPLASTVFLAAETSQSTEIPLYIAEQDEKVTQIQMFSRVANGAAHTDVYTVRKNGVDTTMTLTITNAASGSSTTNPVTLAAGDRLSIKVVTDAATAAADILAQLKVIKI